ncbi:MAG: ATP-binding cassette domain-containing protein [Methylobacterium sp.]|nr:ATP-binding cassette domain-containing protein [Methylobacterium sp.]
MPAAADLRSGEILALLGENGARTSTLMNILFGHDTADAGEVRVADGGRLVSPPPGPRAADTALSASSFPRSHPEVFARQASRETP